MIAGCTGALRGGVLYLTLDTRGSSVNVFTPAVALELERELEAGLAAGARAVVLQSAKPGSFVNGVGLLLAASSHAQGAAMERAHILRRCYERLAAAPVPTIAAIEGNCYGCGLELALACDYRIARDSYDTHFYMPELRDYAFVPLFGATQRLPRLLGLRAAMEVLLGERLDARRAARIGLVDRLAPAQAGAAARTAQASRDRGEGAWIDRLLDDEGPWRLDLHAGWAAYGGGLRRVPPARRQHSDRARSLGEPATVAAWSRTLPGPRAGWIPTDRDPRAGTVRQRAPSRCVRERHRLPPGARLAARLRLSPSRGCCSAGAARRLEGDRRARLRRPGAGVHPGARRRRADASLAGGPPRGHPLRFSRRARGTAALRRVGVVPGGEGRRARARETRWSARRPLSRLRLLTSSLRCAPAGHEAEQGPARGIDQAHGQPGPEGLGACQSAPEVAFAGVPAHQLATGGPRERSRLQQAYVLGRQADLVRHRRAHRFPERHQFLGRARLYLRQDYQHLRAEIRVRDAERDGSAGANAFDLLGRALDVRGRVAAAGDDHQVLEAVDDVQLAVREIADVARAQRRAPLALHKVLLEVPRRDARPSHPDLPHLPLAERRMVRRDADDADLVPLDGGSDGHHRHRAGARLCRDRPAVRQVVATDVVDLQAAAQRRKRHRQRAFGEPVDGEIARSPEAHRGEPAAERLGDAGIDRLGAVDGGAQGGEI